METLSRPRATPRSAALRVSAARAHPQPLADDQEPGGIAHRYTNIPMPHEFGHGPKIYALHHQMTREGMA